LLLFFVVDQLTETPAPTPSDLFRWNLIEKRAQEWKLKRAFTIFRENGVEPILIKGWAAGIHYPESHRRPSIDMDLAVAASDFKKSVALSMAAASEGLAMDIHRELRHLDTASWTDLFDNSRTIPVDDYPIRVLRHEDHLRVLCVHWLTDGGVNKERLWDIYYLVENRPVDFDWDRFLMLVSGRRRRWLVCTLGLAHKYMGLDLSATPIADEASVLPVWLVRSVESSWAKNVKHVPLEVAIFRPATLASQFGRFIRPNPVASTIAMEGSFDARTRIYYQIAGFAGRIGPTLGRIGTSLRQKLK
jgi:hypothetical protein